jgi:hypothetical protein
MKLSPNRFLNNIVSLRMSKAVLQKKRVPQALPDNFLKIKFIYLTNILFFFLLVVLFSCNNKNETTASTSSNKIVEDTTANYFPVTNFIKGDIRGIKEKGANPLHRTTVYGKNDSTWLRIDSVDFAFQEFLEPRIDSANLKKYFSEKSFLDQTLGTFTFSYDRRPGSTFNFPFLNWDVLIDEETKKIKRIYLVKKIDANTIKQLTWQAENWCKIVTITNDKVVREDKIIWDFDEQ